MLLCNLFLHDKPSDLLGNCKVSYKPVQPKIYSNIGLKCKTPECLHKARIKGWCTICYNRIKRTEQINTISY